MIKTAIYPLVATLLLASCATQGRYQEVIQGYVGQDESTLVRKWGAPQRAYESGSSRFLTFSDSRTIRMPNMAPMDVSCVTTFEVVQGKIIGVNSVGNDCISS